MSSYTSFTNFNFSGISRKDSAFSEKLITCSDCQNVELYYTELNSGVGIRTVKGNIKLSKDSMPEGENIIGIFESNQDGNTYCLVYTETDTEGCLYNFIRDELLDTNTLTLIKGGLQVTGKCCATDFIQGYLDMFIFSNGKDLVYVYSNTETHESLVVETDSNLHLIDPLNRPISGLGMYVFDGRLFIFNDKILWYSKQLECRDFHTSSPDDITSAGYVEYVKPITAIYPYLDSMAIFHNDSSCLLKTDGKGKFINTEESPGGCASYNSLVFHGTDLFFYDDTKKGVFSFQQIVNGDKTLGDNIAYDIQKELLSIKSNQLSNIRTLSVVTEDRNEVWMLLPISEDNEHSIVLIFDYIRGAWIKRKCQHINCLAIYKSELYSGGKDIYKEYESNLFNGEYIPHFYTCTIFNLGADNTMKITKFPPRLTVDDSSNCHFWVQYIKNYNILKDPKRKELKAKGFGPIFYYDKGMTYDSTNTYVIGGMDGIVRLPSATFKSLEIKFYTNEKDQAFSIKNIEMSKIKVKQV